MAAVLKLSRFSKDRWGKKAYTMAGYAVFISCDWTNERWFRLQRGTQTTTDQWSNCMSCVRILLILPDTCHRSDLDFAFKRASSLHMLFGKGHLDFISHTIHVPMSITAAATLLMVRFTSWHWIFPMMGILKQSSADVSCVVGQSMCIPQRRIGYVLTEHYPHYWLQSTLTRCDWSDPQRYPCDRDCSNHQSLPAREWYPVEWRR